MEMPPVSKVTAFPTKPKNRRAWTQRLRFIAQHDHSRRLDASLRDSEQRTHFQLGDFAIVENFHAQANFLGHRFGLGSKHARRKAVGRFVDEVAREILRFGDHAAALDRLVDSGKRAIFESGKRDGLNLLVVLFLRAVFIGFEIGDEKAFGDGLRGSGAAFSLAREKREILHAARFQIAQRGAGDFAQVANREFCGLPCPDEKQALRVHALGKMQQHGFESFSCDFATRDQGGKPARHAAIDFGENAIDLVVAFKNIRDERIGLNGRVRLGVDLDLHGFLSILSLTLCLILSLFL